jgi:hypothetical protein
MTRKVELVNAREPMIHVREPMLKPVAIDELHPTQITVGMREVKAKRKQWRRENDKKGAEFLGRHMIPVVLGPGKRHYVIDHHHLARALHDEGVEHVLCTVVHNFSQLDRDTFWFNLDNRGLMHPYDAEGRRRGYKDVPDAVSKLVDDPYRSLAGELRRAGGFAKDTTPFSEFLWADFFRPRIKRKAIVNDFPHAIEKALQLAQSEAANYLPGWCGPAPGD